MQKTCTLLLFLSLASITTFAQTKYFKGELKGSSEVPANAATGFGVVLVQYNVLTNQLDLHGNYMGLTGAITASHIHNAAAGVSGAVMKDITNSGLSSGSLVLTTTLTEAEEVELLAGRVYANVHTATNSSGELRTQLLPATPGQSRHLECNLSAANEVPPNASGATGVMYALLDKGESKLYVTGVFGGLVANATAGHIHTGAVGTTGPVTFPFNITTGVTAGVFSTVSAVTPTQITNLESGNTYCNVHTPTYSGGEIRGQLAVIPDPQLVYFRGLLSGAAETPATPSAAFGVVIVQYDLGTNNFILTGDYQALSAPLTASHVHNGAVGVSGPVLFDVTNTGLTYGNLFANTAITDAQETELLAGNLYTNVHSGLYPGGEVRAQLLPTTEGQTIQLSGIFSGANEVPANASAGTGGINALLDKGTNVLYATGLFTGLGSVSTAGHFHNGAPGVSGPVAYDLNFLKGFTAGVVSVSTPVTNQQKADIEAGLFYANIHSTGFPAGEIRAQLGLGFALPVKLISFNGYRSGNNVQLNWTVENQQDFRDFSIEQVKGNTQEWLHKGVVSANNLSGRQTYQFTDVPFKGSDVLLYRLKMTDVDGNKTYSSIVKINFKNGKAQLVLLSNPVKSSFLRFQLTGIASASEAYASVIDMGGKTLARSGGLQAGTNSINIASLPAGAYKLIITMNNETIETSFIK